MASAPSPTSAAAWAGRQREREQENVLAAFGRVVRELRHERLLTIEAVAEAADVHPNYLGSVERGERNISLFNIWRIAAALDVPVDVMLKDLPRRRGKPARSVA